MAGVNKAILIGNLGADPEARYTQGGQAVANFSLATSERWTGRDGQQQERTEWHRIVTFGKLAETCRDYLSKGRQVYVEGRIQTRSWEDRDGKKRYTTEIVAQTVRFLGQRGDRDGSSRPAGSETPTNDNEGGGGGGGGFDSGPPPIGDDDVPF
ncbi:MAG: single-stranded DNA-binding protein [Deltaproteobacteria bacterium]|nr:single-stranded DNA-binding protein [Deltaproteobacteria bacterium]